MRENHFCRAHHPSPATHRAPGIRVRGGPCPAPVPRLPPARRAMGTAPSAGALATAGGLQPLPSPGAPAGAQLDPSSTWRGWAGASLKPQELHPAPDSLHDLAEALPFWMHHTDTQGLPHPRKNAPAEISPISPRRNAQCCRAATESGTATPDLLPAGNVVRAWMEFNQSRA